MRKLSSLLIALISFVFIINGVFLRRTISFLLCGVLSFNSTSCYSFLDKYAPKATAASSSDFVTPLKENVIAQANPCIQKPAYPMPETETDGLSVGSAIFSAPANPKKGNADKQGYGHGKDYTFYNKPDNQTISDISTFGKWSVNALKKKNLSDLQLKELLKTGISLGGPSGDTMVDLFMYWDTKVKLPNVAKKTKTLTEMPGNVLQFTPGSDLSELISKSSEFLTQKEKAVSEIKKQLQDQLKQEGNINLENLCLNLADFPATNYSPLSNSPLAFLIGGTQGRAIFIKDFSKDKNSYKAKLRFVIYDVFGVDGKDLSNKNSFVGYVEGENLIGKGFRGMVAMWILQHEKTAKPYLEEIIIDVPIDGSIDLSNAQQCTPPNNGAAYLRPNDLYQADTQKLKKNESFEIALSESRPLFAQNGQQNNNCPGASSTGDPHLATFDGLRYDLQTLGELILVKANRGGFEVQARQTPFNNSGSVSVNSAVAMKVGRDRVAFYAEHFPDADTSNPLRVNGKPAIIEGNNKLKLSGGGEIFKQGNLYIVNYPTGEKVVVSPLRAGSNAYFDVSPFVNNQAGVYSGLLGNVNGNPKDDQQIRGGGSILETQSTYGDLKQVFDKVGLRLPGVLNRAEQVYFDQLYKEFANSWRVKQEESLFDYATGQTTKNYLVAGFPDKYLKLDMLTPQQIQTARSACDTAQVSQDMMQGCIFDVGFSGFNEFAYAASQVNEYIKIVNQLFPGLNLPTLAETIEKYIPKNLPIPNLPNIPIPLPNIPFPKIF